MGATIELRRDGDIATVVLSNPDRLNAINLAMWTRLGEIMRQLSNDTAIRCVVLRGAGDKAFSAGADIAEFPRERANTDQARPYGRQLHATLQAVADCRCPTLAMIRGACVGGGLEIASWCDLRLCGASSRFGIPINRLGLAVGHGELQGLLSLAGCATTLELLLEGRLFNADEAYAKGLVSRVVPDGKLEEEAYAAARRIADGAPLVASWHKKFVRRLADPAPLTETELDESFACFDTEDYRTGYEAFLAKTRPAFKGR